MLIRENSGIAAIRLSPLRRHFVPSKVAQVPIPLRSPDGAIADGFANRNGATIRPRKAGSRVA